MNRPYYNPADEESLNVVCSVCRDEVLYTKAAIEAHEATCEATADLPAYASDVPDPELALRSIDFVHNDEPAK